jgi:glycosyltransferase involved in cell wall biosynthesis
LHRIPLAIVIPTLEITPDEKAELRRRHAFGEKEILVVYFGFLHPNKGIEVLLESFALVHNEKPSTKLLMLSFFQPEKQPYHAKVRDQVRALGIEDAISWMGFLPPDEVSHMLSIADVGLLPYEDGVSFRRLSFMTMLSHGVPTVTTVADVSLEDLGLVEEGSVISVPAHSTPRQIASGVLSIINSPCRQETLRNGGRDWARPYQWNEVTKQTLDLYETLVAR